MKFNYFFPICQRDRKALRSARKRAPAAAGRRRRRQGQWRVVAAYRQQVVANFSAVAAHLCRLCPFAAFAAACRRRLLRLAATAAAALRFALQACWLLRVARRTSACRPLARARATTRRSSAAARRAWPGALRRSTARRRTGAQRAKHALQQIVYCADARFRKARCVKLITEKYEEISNFQWGDAATRDGAPSDSEAAVVSGHTSALAAMNGAERNTSGRFAQRASLAGALPRQTRPTTNQSLHMGARTCPTMSCMSSTTRRAYSSASRNGSTARRCCCARRVALRRARKRREEDELRGRRRATRALLSPPPPRRAATACGATAGAGARGTRACHVAAAAARQGHEAARGGKAASSAARRLLFFFF